MSEAPLEMSRTWVEFEDPEHAGQRFRCDLTFLTSRWRCIFGSGCPGIYADRPDDGCCTLGAHLTDADDLERVRAVAAELGEDEWQHHPGTSRPSAWTERVDGERATRVVDGACIFLNRPGFPAGPGCALHQHALRAGTPPHRAKPDVCWQVAIRRSYRTVELPDESSYLEISVGEFDRRAWGPGGHDLDWYCSSSPAAHVASEPVYRHLADELVELMGEGGYAELVTRCEAHVALADTARETGGRTLLPLYVHPATLAAQRPGT